jgi:hypothetical protein
MQLTETQLQTIETYLLSWELQFRDFYDEMFDHFCTEIEQRMSNGTSFDNALADASYLFSEHKYKGDKYAGLKAYEMEWFDKRTAKNKELLIIEFKRQVIGPKLLIWVAAYFAIYQACLYFDQPKLWAITMIPMVLVAVFAQIKLKTLREFTWKKMLSAFDYKNFGVHKSKDTLFAKPHTFMHNINRIMLILTLCLGVSNLFINFGGIALRFHTACGVLFLMIAVVINNVTDEVIKQEKALGNKLLTNAD